MNNANPRHAVWGSLFAGVFLLLVGLHPARANAASCESLATLALPDTTITSASPVAAGEFSLPGGAGAATATNPFVDLPAFCRVTASLHPTSDSDIRVEVWLPTAGWNGKYQAVGNGGWAGVITYPAMAQAVRHGYATSSTDTGHVGNRGTFALGHPEKVTDFGYRAVHEMTAKAKAVIEAFYGNGPRLSYWNGCSTGGRQGLKEAQRYPFDFNGIIAGAAANPRIHLGTWDIWIGHVVLKDKASYIAPSKYAMIHKAVLDACDALDGIKDGLISDPPRCRFNPRVLLCKGPETPTCLTAAQVEAARKLYGPVKNPRTGSEIFPPYEPGSELGWAVLAKGPDPNVYALDQFKYVVFQDPNWDWRTFNFDSDVALAEKVDNNTQDASDPNLKDFAGHGGKLLMYHGWSDPQVAPLASVNYYNSVVETMGGSAKTSSWIRLFMAPGMGHCRGGEGPDVFDTMSAMEQWVEVGKAPDQLLASHSANGVVDRTRPLCPYPQTAQYKGSGSTDDAANFVCKLR